MTPGSQRVVNYTATVLSSKYKISTCVYALKPFTFFTETMTSLARLCLISTMMLMYTSTCCQGQGHMQVRQQPTVFEKLFGVLQDILGFGGHRHADYDHMRGDMRDIRSALNSLKDEFEKLEHLRTARFSIIERQLDSMNNQVEMAENRQDRMRTDMREELMKLDNLRNARLSEIERRLDRMENKIQATENEQRIQNMNNWIVIILLGIFSIAISGGFVKWKSSKQKQH